jgi:hypothetical protein
MKASAILAVAALAILVATPTIVIPSSAAETICIGAQMIAVGRADYWHFAAKSHVRCHGSYRDERTSSKQAEVGVDPNYDIGRSLA